LHQKKIVHRDIKAANILLSKDKKLAMVGDMNVSKVAKENEFLSTQTGTPYYASPEVWNDKPYDQKSDIWSLGCMIYELCTLKPPF
jgi:NIMA (never in mitosis gene a)-related kinase 1/4/5